MPSKKVEFSSEKELNTAILEDKANGVPDIEIGDKYGVDVKHVERVVTKVTGVNVSAIKTSKKIKTLEPKDFKEEQTTVWSFKQRANLATHSVEYRGKWSPYIQ